MATVKVCDECGKQKARLPFTVTENSDGSVYELCSVLCLDLHGKKKAAL
jgi:hypothetical protein